MAKKVKKVEVDSVLANLLKEKEVLEMKSSVNHNELNNYCKRKIVEWKATGTKQNYIAGEVKINETTFSTVMTDKKPFSIKEIERIILIIQTWQTN